VLAKGEISVALRLRVSGASRPAVEAVEKAGGSITLTVPAPAAQTAE
jgi:large subunit ribosomal protein L15